MLASRLGAVVALLSLMACERIREGVECTADGKCGNGLVCEPAFNLCVTERPVVTVLRPVASDRFDGGSLVLSGKVTGGDDGKSAEYKLGAPEADGVWVPLELSPEGNFTSELPLPDTDQVKFQITVRALNGNKTPSLPVSVAPIVDTRPPSVASASPADGSRATPDTKFVLRFSEAVRLPANALRLTPSAAPIAAHDGEWTDRVELSLEPGTHYVAELAAEGVTDRFGHPLQEGFVHHFYTAPRAPLAGTSIDVAPNTLIDFGAAADFDGVVTVVAKIRTNAGVVYQWRRFHPVTGEPELINLVAGSAQDTQLEVVAGATLTSETTRPTRVSGFIRGDGTAAGAQAYWRVDDGAPAPSRTSAPGLVPFGPNCADQGTSPVGFVSGETGGAAYVRPPAAAAPLQFSPSITAARSASSWEALVVSGADLRRQSTRVDCGPPAFASFAYNASIASNLAAEPHLSVALAEIDRALYVYTDDQGRRRELCAACVYDTAGVACPVSETRSAPSSDWVVASGHEGGKMLGAGRLIGQTVELQEADLSASCHEPWKSLGSVHAPAGLTKFLPLRFGSRAGVLVQSGSNLQVLYPPITPK